MGLLFISLLYLGYLLRFGGCGPLYPSNDLSEGNITKFPSDEFIIRHNARGYYDDPLFDLHPRYCRKPAQCQPLNFTRCMGAKLPYHATTLELTDLETQDKVQEMLHLFQYLRYIPKCWSVIQPFLCALYMPKCDNGMVDLPSREMCRVTLSPCKIFYNSSMFPKLIDCEDDRIFPSKCKNDVHELKFNTTGFCMDPLVKTDERDWFYPDVEGCGLRCKDPLYTENELDQIHKFITCFLLVCLPFELFTIFTFIIDWNTTNKFPSVTIFYMNVCSFIMHAGWFLGLVTRDSTVCKNDGTLRMFEPRARENLYCAINFILVYYFLMAEVVWFAIFGYTWHMRQLHSLSKTQERVDKKSATFHLVAWCVPIVLTVTTMASGQVDGDYVTGICFVNTSSLVQAGLVLAPITIAIVGGVVNIVSGLVLLNKVKKESREYISEHSSRKIESNMIRVLVYTILEVIFYVITLVYYVYMWNNMDGWNSSLRSHNLCQLTSFSTDHTHCKLEGRPSVAMLQLQLLAVFGSSINNACWYIRKTTVRSWMRYIRKKFGCETEEPMNLQKHKVIALAYAKRQKYIQGDKVSIECHRYPDPINLNVDPYSADSNLLSDTWAAHLPQFISRRGAIFPLPSYQSEVSLSVKQVSIESADSQMSVQIAEFKATRRSKVNSRSRSSKSRRSRDSRKNRRENHRSRGPPASRRHSRSSGGGGGAGSGGTRRSRSTSVDESQLHQQLEVIANTCEVKTCAPNLKRRAANAGIVGPQIGELLANGKLMLPFSNGGANGRRRRSASEDENVSVTISESKYNMVISDTNKLDLADQLVLRSLRQGLPGLDWSTDSEEEVHDRRQSRTDSRRSRRSKRSTVKSFNSEEESYNVDDEEIELEHLDSSPCPEIEQLLE